MQGILQPDMWGVTPSSLWNWDALREMISKNGVRNSLLLAPMPTASTSQILGNNECFEPYTSNIYSRRVLRFAMRTYPIQFILISVALCLLSNPLSLQWWICCGQQTSSSWFDWDGPLVSCSEEQNNLWGWLCPQYSRNPRWSEVYIQVWISEFLHSQCFSLCF